MSQVSRDFLKVSRVLYEDKDFVTLEVGKHDDVTFHLQQDETGKTVGGDKFLTVIFVHEVSGRAEPWNPFDADD